MPKDMKCKICEDQFEIGDDEIKFLSDVSPEINGVKYDLPLPKLCPVCRSRNRMIFRNIRNLTRRKCDGTGKDIFSHFDDKVTFLVYDAEYWWSDQWDGLKYGRDLDLSRSFFEQYKDLYNLAPACARNIVNVEDCDYTDGIDNCKHCFLSFGIGESEDCYYCSDTRKSKSCLDCLAILKCEFCYSCTRCNECYDVRYSIRCSTCRESMFLLDCRNVSNSIGCCNKTSGQYLIFNKQVTKEEYQKKVKELENLDNLEKFSEEFEKFQLQFPKKFYHGNNCDNFSGDDIRNLKNAKNTFYAENVEDVWHCNYVFDAKNCMDYDIYGFNSNWIYQGLMQGENCSRNIFCMQTWSNCANNIYCNSIVGCKNCFGCSGLKHKEYCILNKQYTKEEYEQLVPKIIEKMKQDGEWGNFFPFTMSPFAFNETSAQEYYPMSKDGIVALGCRFEEPRDLVPNQTQTIDSSTLPESIDEVDEGICSKVIKCKQSGRLYQIQKGELGFYQSKKIPLPQLHSEVRHMDRVKKRNPYLLWSRECMCEETDHGHSGKCANQFETSFAPERPEKVYCEDCYQRSVI